MARQSSSVISSGRWPLPMPALLSTTSTTPKRASAASKAASTLARSVTSRATDSACLPFHSMSLATCSSRSTRRAASTTRAPARPASRARCAPMPLEAPVTRTVRPAREKCWAKSWFIGTPRTGRPHPCHRRRTWSPPHTSRHGADLRARRARPCAHRSCHKDGRWRWHHR
ncbi:hypothetical protein D3C84_109950 [compost metagenome]